MREADALSTIVIVGGEDPPRRPFLECRACRVSADLDQPVPFAELYRNVVNTNDDGSTSAEASRVRRYAQNVARFEERGKEQLPREAPEIEFTFPFHGSSPEHLYQLSFFASPLSGIPSLHEPYDLANHAIIIIREDRDERFQNFQH